MRASTICCFLGVLLLGPQGRCETPQIANPSAPVASEIPLYGVSGNPQEYDIRQGSTPDCFLEAAVAAVVRISPQTVTEMLVDNGNGSVSVTCYGNNSQQTTVQVEKKDFEARLLSQDSASSWITVLQDAYEKLLVTEGLPDSVHNGDGSSPNHVFAAIYGPEAEVIIAACDQMSTVGEKASSRPSTLCTNASSGELVDGHCYTVHTANSSHITLRNPWGVVNTNDWGIPITGGSDIHSLGYGIFEIPTSSVFHQCTQLTYVDHSNSRRLARRSPSKLEKSAD